MIIGYEKNMLNQQKYYCGRSYLYCNFLILKVMQHISIILIIISQTNYVKFQHIQINLVQKKYMFSLTIMMTIVPML